MATRLCVCKKTDNKNNNICSIDSEEGLPYNMFSNRSKIDDFLHALGKLKSSIAHKKRDKCGNMFWQWNKVKCDLYYIILYNKEDERLPQHDMIAPPNKTEHEFPDIPDLTVRVLSLFKTNSDHGFVDIFNTARGLKNYNLVVDLSKVRNENRPSKSQRPSTIHFGFLCSSYMDCEDVERVGMKKLGCQEGSTVTKVENQVKLALQAGGQHNVKYLACTEIAEGGTAWVAMELCIQTFDALIDLKPSDWKFINEERMKICFRHILRGLSHLHSKNIKHGDIRMENVLLSLDGKCLKIGEYDRVKRIKEGLYENAVHDDLIMTASMFLKCFLGKSKSDSENMIENLKKTESRSNDTSAIPPDWISALTNLARTITTSKLSNITDNFSAVTSDLTTLGAADATEGTDAVDSVRAAVSVDATEAIDGAETTDAIRAADVTEIADASEAGDTTDATDASDANDTATADATGADDTDTDVTHSESMAHEERNFTVSAAAEATEAVHTTDATGATGADDTNTDVIHDKSMGSEECNFTVAATIKLTKLADQLSTAITKLSNIEKNFSTDANSYLAAYLIMHMVLDKPASSEVLQHPYFWTEHKILYFISRMEGYFYHPDTVWRHGNVDFTTFCIKKRPYEGSVVERIEKHFREACQEQWQELDWINELKEASEQFGNESIQKKLEEELKSKKKMCSLSHIKSFIDLVACDHFKNDMTKYPHDLADEFWTGIVCEQTKAEDETCTLKEILESDFVTKNWEENGRKERKDKGKDIWKKVAKEKWKRTYRKTNCNLPDIDPFLSFVKEKTPDKEWTEKCESDLQKIWQAIIDDDKKYNPRDITRYMRLIRNMYSHYHEPFAYQKNEAVSNDVKTSVECLFPSAASVWKYFGNVLPQMICLLHKAAWLERKNERFPDDLRQFYSNPKNVEHLELRKPGEEVLLQTKHVLGTST